MGALFGKPSSSSSSNVNNGMLTQKLGGTVDLAGNAGSMLQALLGGGPGGDAAFNNYKNSTGYKGVMDAGTEAIGNSQAAKGMFQSGATGKALSNFGQETGKSFFNNYLDKIMGMGSLGINAGQVLAGSGQQSQQQGGKKGLFGSVLGGIL